MVVCPNCGKPTRVGIRRNGNGYERLCKKCGKSLDVKAAPKKTVTKKSTKK
jgi:hypothetical protein